MKAKKEITYVRGLPRMLLIAPAREVRIDVNRWDITLEITTEDGEQLKFRASADEAFAQRDGIWFDTEEEYRKGPP